MGGGKKHNKKGNGTGLRRHSSNYRQKWKQSLAQQTRAGSKKTANQNYALGSFTFGPLTKSQLEKAPSLKETENVTRMESTLASFLEHSESTANGRSAPLYKIFEQIGIEHDENLLYAKTSDVLNDNKNQSDVLTNEKIQTLEKQVATLKKDRDANFKTMAEQLKTIQNYRASVKALKSKKNNLTVITEEQKALKKEILQQQVYIPPISVDFLKANQVLADHCAAHKYIVKFFNKHFAHTQALSSIMSEKTKDRGVIKRALQRGISTIFTYDKRMKNDKDLCFIANEIFENPSLINSKYGVSDHQGPLGIIVLPNNLVASEMEKLLINNQFTITSHIAKPSQAILDLR